MKKNIHNIKIGNVKIKLTKDTKVFEPNLTTFSLIEAFEKFKIKKKLRFLIWVQDQELLEFF